MKGSDAHGQASRFSKYHKELPDILINCIQTEP